MKLTRRGKLVAIILGLIVAWIAYRIGDAAVTDCVARGIDEWQCKR